MKVKKSSFFWLLDAVTYIMKYEKYAPANTQIIYKGIPLNSTQLCLGYQKWLQGQKILKISHFKLQLKSRGFVYSIVTKNNWDIEICSQKKLFGTGTNIFNNME